MVQQGRLTSGTIALINTTGNVEAFPTAVGEPPSQYTIAALDAKGKPFETALAFDPASNTLTACPIARRSARYAETKKSPMTCPPAPAQPVNYLLRVPKGVHAYITTTDGDIHVSDVSGPVDAFDATGSIKIQVPSYAQARTVNGNVSVTFGELNWPGTLHFSAQNGDVEVYVPAVANAHVDMRTDHGTIFTDFDLRGTSNGASETITGNIGAGGNRGVNIRVKSGSIRLLKLTPQM